MLKVGLTGSIGSGKTVVATIFEKMGVPVYHADFEARKMLSYENVKTELLERFGDKIFDAAGHVDRKILGEIVFNESAALDNVNKLIHPLVKADFDNWLRNFSDSHYVIHEAAILFESGFSKYFEKVITVDAPPELCISRVINRDHVTREQVMKRIQNQWQSSEKTSRSDFVITNDEHMLVIPQVLEIHRKLEGMS